MATRATSAVRGRAGILSAIEEALRARGYDGASIADIAEATGLGKSSLYHHFPGGKPEMAAACAEALAARMGENLAALEALGRPADKLAAFFAALDVYFASGERMCLMAMMGTSSASADLRPILSAAIGRTIASIAGILVEGGVAPALARERAEDAFAQIQGAVVLARATGDSAVFRRLVASLPARLLAKS